MGRLCKNKDGPIGNDDISRTWEITWNNYTEADIDLLRSWKDEVVRMHVAKEVGEKGTPHLQGRITFKRQYRWGAANKLCDGRCWFKKTKATADWLYCMKSGSETVISVDNRKRGSRSDLEEVADLVTSGASRRQIALQHPVPFMKFHRGIDALRHALIEPRNQLPTVTCLVGPTGSGKSRRARELAPDAWVWAPAMKDWFDGYEGQKDAIFEEFRGQIAFGFMLVVLDRHACPVQVKGGRVEFAATNIVLTSPMHPKFWYPSHQMEGDDNLKQLMRRITKVIELK